MPVATTAPEESSPFIKQLASSDRRIRDHALSSLRTYLDRSAPLSELDCLKLWKALFYSMWMSDKPLTQQRLARELADLFRVVVKRSHANFLAFVQAFWTTMAREWAGIDALRMDKFLYLVRCVVGSGFDCLGACQKEPWGDEKFLENYIRILEAVPFDPRDTKIPNGLRFHVIDIYVEELDKVDTTRTAPVDKLLAPLQRLLKETITKPVRQRVQEALEDERLKDWQAVDMEGMDEATAPATAKTDDGAKVGVESDDEFGGFGD